jgi:hypothetical protein
VEVRELQLEAALQGQRSGDKYKYDCSHQLPITRYREPFDSLFSTDNEGHVCSFQVRECCVHGEHHGMTHCVDNHSGKLLSILYLQMYLCMCYLLFRKNKMEGELSLLSKVVSYSSLRKICARICSWFSR